MITCVVEGKIWRGPAPKSEDWPKLKALGVEHILDLQCGSQLIGDNSPLEEALVAESHGFSSYAHPLGGFCPPSAAELELAVDFLQFHKPVYIHCHAGVDRTGMVIAHYRIEEQGWSKSGAVKEMKKMGMHWWYYWWAWFL